MEEIKEKVTASQIIERACNKFCDDYCKYSVIINGIEDEAESDAKVAEFCTDCPINDIF